MTEHAPDTVAHELLASLSSLMRRLRQTRPIADLAPPETQALATLVAFAPLTSAELARHEGISPQSVGVTVSGLQRRGLVRRRPDPDDGRRQLLELTPQGHQCAQDKQGARVEQLVTVLGSQFSAEERAVLHAAAPLLERIAATLATSPDRRTP